MSNIRKGGEVMYFMEATKQNESTVNEIIKILADKEYPVQEALAVLDYAKRKIVRDSKTIYKEELFFTD